MRVNVDGVSLELTDKDLVGSGGQGQVFVKGHTAYKIYTDPQFMLPTAKIAELQKVDHPAVIKPLNVIHDSKRAPVGYTMQYVKGGSPLCQLYTRPFRESNNIGPSSIQALVDEMANIVAAAHKANTLLVDLNEMNFLAEGAKFDKLWAIDVDSWQTPSFPAQAIMPSVRDPHTPKFNTGSDWYSWAIVTFQLYVGIHPYRGKHPTLKGFEERMKANASVFGKDVRIPACCYPFDAIPTGLRAWYEKVFEKGVRTAPDAIGTIVRMLDLAIAAPVSSSSVSVTKMADLPTPFLRVYPTNSGPIIASPAYLQFLGRAIQMVSPEAFYTDGAIGYALWAHGEALEVLSTTGKRQRESIAADNVVQFGPRVAVKMDGTLSEMSVLTNATTGEFTPVFRLLCQVMPGAKVFSNCLIQEMLGAKVLVASPAAKMVYQPVLKELQKFRVINAKLDGTVLMTVSERTGTYYRHIFRFNADFSDYDCQDTSSPDQPSINFVVTPKNIVVLVDENDQIVLFSAGVASKAVKVVDANGAVISSDRLYMDGDKVMFARNKSTYWMRVK